ncbi:hypothetical protein LguiB_027212 [Lonicera macranthoides]
MLAIRRSRLLKFNIFDPLCFGSLKLFCLLIADWDLLRLDGLVVLVGTLDPFGSILNDITTHLELLITGKLYLFLSQLHLSHR